MRRASFASKFRFVSCLNYLVGATSKGSLNLPSATRVGGSGKARASFWSSAAAGGFRSLFRVTDRGAHKS